MNKPLLTLSVTLGLLSGCACNDVVATGDTSAHDATVSTTEDANLDAYSLFDAARPDMGTSVDANAPDGSLVAFCAGDGPIVVVGDGETAVCTGTVAESSFRNALCSCQDYVSSFPLTTDSFDSSRGPYTPADAETGANVGVNGNWNSTARSEIGGSLTVAGSSAMAISAALLIHGRLQAGGRIDHSGTPLTIDHDAFVAGDLIGNPLVVGGTLTQPAGRTHDMAAGSTVASVATAPVAVEAPCACESLIVDVGALVSRYATSNDNATVGIDPEALRNYAAGTTVELPCGRFYFAEAHGAGALTLRITARTAVFIEGDLSLGGNFNVELVGPNAEIDLFVSGNIVAPGAFVLGSADAPARARLYVGGTGTVQLSGSALSAGNIYAPRAELVAAGGLELYGSIFAERVASTGPITIHYDRAINRAGEECPPPTECTGCGDCGSRACVDGSCSDCTNDGDCCGFDVCEEGRCVAEIF